MDRKLKPPKNLRWAKPRVCAFCRWFKYTGFGSAECERDPEDMTWDTGDEKYYQQVCDRYKMAR